MNIYVGNLSYRMNDKELEELFSKFGAVKSAKVIMDRETGNQKVLVLLKWKIHQLVLKQSKL